MGNGLTDPRTHQDLRLFLAVWILLLPARADLHSNVQVSDKYSVTSSPFCAILFFQQRSKVKVNFYLLYAHPLSLLLSLGYLFHAKGDI